MDMTPVIARADALAKRLSECRARADGMVRGSDEYTNAMEFIIKYNRVIVLYNNAVRLVNHSVYARARDIEAVAAKELALATALDTELTETGGTL